VTSVSLGLEIPTVFSLEQNYPNPFNPKTTIKYGLPTESNVKIEVYNMLGQKVSELVNEVQSAHYYETIWDATNVSSGLYLFKIEATDINDSANKFTSVKKMVLLK
ncbi:MAG: T9SS type A sorting domain-containing protein, partial [Ignavibacteria bacterium]|nr:T9SS type A sorting domain-containing protein [Bacteroidota bacterium]MSQ46174.1 T9SS type A sorting domain-containing protein [Ignavibacteria bacterium]